MRQKIKRAILHGAKATGQLTRVSHSAWRRERLLILCYHGVSIADEHLWNPGLYISPEVFRTRLEMLRDGEFAVLPLTEALERLYQGTLPPRAVAITFDDGARDFYTRAVPLLDEFRFPATLYLTTYYCRHQMPVFNTMFSYLLWKGMGKSFDMTGLLKQGGRVEIHDETTRQRVRKGIVSYLGERGASAEEKQELLIRIAQDAGVDFGKLEEEKLLYQMTPEQVRKAADSGIDIQLHTHRHRTPRDARLFERELQDNAREIHAMTGRDTPLKHFCYPSGDYSPMFFPLLKQAGVQWSTTCETGLADRNSNPLLLPRLLDVNTLSPIELEGWLTGFSARLPSL